MKRNLLGILLFFITLPGLAWGWNTFHRTPFCKDCNVILISVDTLSSKHLPCYGYGRNTAPNLCAFGNDNIFFPHAFGNGTYTLPTHVSMMTGLYPGSHGVTDVGKKLNPELPFLPTLLKNEGYATMFLMDTKNPHMPVDDVYNRGIETMLDTGSVSWKSAFDEFVRHVSQGEKTFLFIHAYDVHPPYRQDEITGTYTRDSIPWMFLRESDVRDISEDFITNMRIALRNDIANGIIANPSREQELLDKLIVLADDTEAVRTEIRSYPDILARYRDIYDPLIRIEPGNARETSYLSALYDEKINRFDSGWIPELISFITRSDIRNNTVVILTSDHGEEFGEHGFMSHTTLYRGNTDVLLAMYIPGVRRTIGDNVQTVDITPTILTLIGAPARFRFDGTNVFSKTGPRVLVAERKNQKTLRWGRWKLFVDTKGPVPVPTELYDTRSDPDEMKNVVFSRLKLAKRIIGRWKLEQTKGVNQR